MKSIYRIASLPVIIAAGIFIYELISINVFYTVPPGRYYISTFMYATLYMFPFILVYSLLIEEKSGAQYQLLLLPVSKRSFILSKFLSIISFGILLTWVISLRSISPIPGIVRTRLYDIISRFSTVFQIQFFYYYLSHIFLYSSIVCIAYGVMVACKRYRILAGITVFISCLSIFLMIYKSITPFPMDFTMYSFIARRMTFEFFPYFAGIVYLLIGLFLYEKYAEV